MLALYAKAIRHRPSTKNNGGGNSHIPIMPTVECEKIVHIHPMHCNAYNKLTCWAPSLSALVHPNYIQTLSLPLQLSMMVNKAFPFSPLGIVHVANQITATSLPEQTDSLRIRTLFGRVYFHRKGWLFEVLTLASSTNIDNATKPQIRATSFYLVKAKHAAKTNHIAGHDMPQWIEKAKAENAGEEFLNRQTQSLKFSSRIGRQYAKVSGDYNPIHLHQLSAQLFGFKTAIAHGMYSKALVISNIAKQLHFYKSEFEINALFTHPIGLPTQAKLTSCITDKQTCDFQLLSSSPIREQIFLSGSIRQPTLA